MDNTNNCVLVWTDFYKAPEKYQKLSQQGGDEEGVMLVPPGVEIPWWLERCWDIYGDPQIEELPEGKVIIWSH